MQRKKASLAEVYDARALRIVVDDVQGKRHKVCFVQQPECIAVNLGPYRKGSQESQTARCGSTG